MDDDDPLRGMDFTEPTAPIEAHLYGHSEGQKLAQEFAYFIDHNIAPRLELVVKFGGDRDQFLRAVAKLLRQTADTFDPPG